jgi:hypothetical protein
VIVSGGCDCQSEKILIGQNAYLEARMDIQAVIRGTADMGAEALYGGLETKQGAVSDARNILKRSEQIDLLKQARLRTWYGDITLNIIASGDDVNGLDRSDQIYASAAERRNAGQTLTNKQAENEIKVTAKINT